MQSLNPHRWPVLLLWALAGFNLLVAAAVPWVLIGLAPRTPFPGPSFTAAEIFATLEFIAAELLLLGFWTGLYDPRYSVRWLTIMAVLLCGAVVFAADFHLLLWAYYPRSGGPTTFEYRYVLVVGSAIAFIVVGFLFVLLTHCGLWVFRALFGWRLVLGEDAAAKPRRQFGVAQGLLWMGLIGALLGLGRAFAGQDWFLTAIVVAAVSGCAAALLVTPTLWTFYSGRKSRWPSIRFLMFVIALTIAEGAACYYLSFIRGVFHIGWIFAIVLVFNLAIVVATWFNAWALKNIGTRFVTRRQGTRATVDNSTATSPAVV